MKLEKLWVAFLLPALIFLLFVSASYAITTTTMTNNANIQAHVTVIPAVTGICFPQTFIVKEAFGNVTCFVETVGIDASQLNPNSITLGIQENSTPGIHIIPGSVTYVNDFNNNGIHDLFVQFDFSKIRNYFAGLSLPGNFHYQISGSEPVTPFSFTQTSPVATKLNVPAPTRYAALTDYTTTFHANGGQIVVANGFRLSKYTAQTNRLDGSIVQRVSYPNENVNTWDTIRFSSEGYLTVDSLFIPFLPPFFSIKLYQQLNVIDNGIPTCSANTNSITICTSSGWMIKQGANFLGLGENGRIQLNTIVYIIAPTGTKIFGFDANNNKILEIENMNLSSLVVSQSTSS